MAEQIGVRDFESRDFDTRGTDSEVYFKNGEAEKLYDSKVYVAWPEIVWTYADVMNRVSKLGPWNLGKAIVLPEEPKWDVTLSVNPVYSTFITERKGVKIPSTSSPLVNGINYRQLFSTTDLTPEFERMDKLGVSREELKRMKEIRKVLENNTVALADIVKKAKDKIEKVGKKSLKLSPFFFMDINCMVTSPADRRLNLTVTDVGMSIRDISSQILTPGKKIDMV